MINYPGMPRTEVDLIEKVIEVFLNLFGIRTELIEYFGRRTESVTAVNIFMTYFRTFSTKNYAKKIFSFRKFYTLKVLSISVYNSNGFSFNRIYPLRAVLEKCNAVVAFTCNKSVFPWGSPEHSSFWIRACCEYNA